jgi:signal transduction histidine kinase
VGVIPVMLAFVILSLAIINSSRQGVAGRLEATLERIRFLIDSDMEKNRVISSVFSKNILIESLKKGSTNIMPPGFSLNSFSIDMVSFTFYTNIVLRYSLHPESSAYFTTDSMRRYIWDFLANPYYTPEHSLTFPDIVSNMVVMRNCSTIYDNEKKKKIGLSIVSAVLDTDYLKSLDQGNPDLIVFIETPQGILFSRSVSKNMKETEAVIRDTETVKPGVPQLIDLKAEGKYYVFKTALYSLPSKGTIHLGILYGFETVNAMLNLFQQVSFVIFFIGVLLASIIAIVFARKITIPLLVLKSMVKDFQSGVQAIPSPDMVSDEISLLQQSFSEMATDILSNKEKLNSYNSALSREVETKTQDLLNKVRVLTLINDFSSFSMKTEIVDETRYIERVILELRNLLRLNYISVFNQMRREVVKMHFLYSNPKFPEPDKRIFRIEERAAKRVFSSAEIISRSSGGFCIMAFPVYFVDQLEYGIVIMCESKKGSFILDTMSTILNLIAMKIYSIRINSEKIHSEKLASLGQFASTIIHDIKNPLTIIRSGIEVLGDEDFTANEKDEYLRMIMSEIDRLTNMLNDILDFAKGSIILHYEQVEIDPLIENLSRMFVQKAEKHNIKLVIDCESGITLKIDKYRMIRTLSNIITNAIEAVGDGGKITISTQKKIFDLLIKIEDNGPGIPEDIKNLIFEPFITHGKKEGTGLGLSIVKKIIEAHGGNITFKSAPGSGTTFYISLPL